MNAVKDDILRLQLIVATNAGEYFLVLNCTMTTAISSLQPLVIAVYAQR